MYKMFSFISRIFPERRSAMIGCLMIHGYTGGPKEIEPLAEFLREQTDWQIEVPVLSGHGEKLQLDEVTYDIWIKESEEALIELKKECEQLLDNVISMSRLMTALM